MLMEMKGNVDRGKDVLQMADSEIRKITEHNVKLVDTIREITAQK